MSRRAGTPDLAGRIAAKTARIGIIGLGYVGLPLACLFAEKGFDVIGFDIDPKKIGVLCRAQLYQAHPGHPHSPAGEGGQAFGQR